MIADGTGFLFFHNPGFISTISVTKPANVFSILFSDFVEVFVPLHYESERDNEPKRAIA